MFDLIASWRARPGLVSGRMAQRPRFVARRREPLAANLRGRPPTLRTTALLMSIALLSVGCTLFIVRIFPSITTDDPRYRAAVLADALLGSTVSADRSRLAAAAPVGLGAFTPTASFLGNQTGLVGAALKPSSGLAGSLLVRETNCSLTQYAFADTADGVTPSLTIFPGFDAYAHRISGLTALAGAFPKGCADRRSGTPSAPGAFLGRASNGDLLGVSVNDGPGQITLLRLDVQGKVLGTTALGQTGAASTIAAVDLNGDGIADVVTPLITSGGVSGVGVFLSRPDGSFGPVTVYQGYPSEVSRFVARVSIEDVNGDGKPDIVAVANSLSFSSTPTVVTLLGGGDGTFRPGPIGTKEIGSRPFVIADFDGDGKTDLLTADGLLMAGNGDGSFGPPAQRLNATIDARSLAVGDFNGDGKPDVAIVSTSTSPLISIYAGNGDGTFAVKATYAGIRGANYINAADIDGDGNLDIVVGLAGPGAYGPDVSTFTVMQFLLGRGDATFAGAPAIVRSGSLLSNAPSFALADFNGDGVPDLVVPRIAGSGGDIVAYAGTASGQFASGGTPVALSLQAQAITAGDLNADGKTDLVVASFDSLAVFAGRGDGGFGAQQTYALPAGNGHLTNLAVGDVDADGRADVVVTMGQQSATAGGVFVYIANADGTLKTPVQVDPTTNLVGLAVGDLNGDGRADIVVGGADPQFYTSGKVLNGVRVYRSNADGSFTLSATFQQPNGVAYGALAIGDINKDGKADLVFDARDAQLNDSVHVALGNGDGTFRTPVAFDDTGGPGVSALAVGDFNDDGNPDIIVAGDSYPELLIGKGDGTFKGSVALTIGGSGTYVAAADLNKDGMIDAVMGTANGIVPLLRTKSVVDTTSPPVADFSIVAAPASQTVTTGQSASTVVTLTPTNGFQDTVALSCTALPAGASCAFAPASLVVVGSAVTATVTISTAAKAAAFAGSVQGWGQGPGSTPTIVAAGAILFALGLGRRHGSARVRSSWRVAGVLGLASLLTACGDDNGPSSSAPIGAPPAGGTPAGTYVIGITAAGATVNHSATFMLIVK